MIILRLRFRLVTDCTLIEADPTRQRDAFMTEG